MSQVLARLEGVSKEVGFSPRLRRTCCLACGSGLYNGLLLKYKLRSLLTHGTHLAGRVQMGRLLQIDPHQGSLLTSILPPNPELPFHMHFGHGLPIANVPEHPEATREAGLQSTAISLQASHS